MKKLFLIVFSFQAMSLLAMDGIGNKDTVQALVVTKVDASDAYDISDLNGKEIIHLIDSLLELDEVPNGLIKEIDSYSRSRLLNRLKPVAISYFNDTSQYPSNILYHNWDNYQLFPYSENLRENDEVIKLVIEDKMNFCDYVPPVIGVVTSNFGWRNGRNHSGMDIDLEVWDTVRAAFDGMVRVSRFHPGYGRVVIIRHYNGLETLYGHLHRLKVKPGDVVAAGDLIGLGGSSGHSTGSHLHFELRFKAIALNPRSIINYKTNQLISDSIQLVKNRWDYAVFPLGIKYHTVQKGEYLYGIAEKYGTTVVDICQLNGISRNRPLHLGQKLRIGS